MSALDAAAVAKGGWRKNAAGVKDGAQCYRTIGGRRWGWFAEDVAQLRTIGARCRTAPGGGCFVHPDDEDAAVRAILLAEAGE